MADSDLKVGERVLDRRVILTPGDPVFDPRFRPVVETAIPWLMSYRGAWLVPYASVSFDHHSGLKEQNLFRSLFGRDSLIIADFLGGRVPGLRYGVICALAELQGEIFDSVNEEEPGRIAHEVREVNDPRGIEIMEAEGWKFPYYGSVDSTLLWLKALAKETLEDPGILDVKVNFRTLAERAVMATKWILGRIESPSGLIESCRSNPHGIKNQVWKDSGDSYMHHDGRVASNHSVTSIETSGQTFDALQAARQIQSLRPYLDWPLSETELDFQAAEIRRKTLDLMWLGDHFALATERNSDGTQEALDSLASNQGRILDSALLDGPEWILYSRAIADAMTDPEMLGPAGLRTLSRNHPSYRPGGYHTGSAWPMDGILVGRGLLRHGFTQQASDVINASVSAIESIGGFPEYFRSDAPLYGWVTSEVMDIEGAADGSGEGFNRVCQPPQMIQGWTVAAYAWAKNHRQSWYRW